jgi:hypothetical protein
VPDDPLHRRVRAELDGLGLDPGALRTPALRSAIRRRRRTTGWGAAGAAALLAATAAVAGAAGLPSGRPVTVVPAHSATAVAPDQTRLSCGQPVNPEPGPDLLLSASPRRASVEGPGIVELTVTLTNSTASTLRGSTGHLDVTVYRDGHVVAEPSGKRLIAYQVDLPPGASMPLTGGLALQDCRDSGPPVMPPPVTLPAGTYQVYAEATLLTGTGEPMIIQGGPWPLTVG